MKKVLAVLAVVLMLSASAFASPAELVGLGGTPLQFTNLEENALLNPALLDKYASKVVIGIEFPVPSFGPEAEGLVILPVGPGTLQIGAGPRAWGSTDWLSVGASAGNIPDSTFNLGYALAVGGMKVGLSAAYGVDNYSSKNMWVADVELVGKDENYTNNEALKFAVGVALDAGMPIDAAISIAMPNFYNEQKDFDNVNNKLQNNDRTSYSALDIALDAKTEIAAMILALNVTLNTLQYKYTDWQDADVDGTANVNTVTTNDDSSLDISLLAGKVIKANDNLKVTLGTGLNLVTSGAYKSVTEDKVASTKTINNSDASSGMLIKIPFTMAVNVELGKLLTISNDKLAASVGLTKEVIVLNNYNNKTINVADESTDSLTNYSDLSNITPVLGAVGIKWVLGDSTVAASAGAKILGGGPLLPNLALSFIYGW